MKIKVKNIRTLKSVYDMNSIEIKSEKGNVYRMKVEELIPLIESVPLARNKKQKYTYLTIK